MQSWGCWRKVVWPPGCDDAVRKVNRPSHGEDQWIHIFLMVQQKVQNNEKLKIELRSELSHSNSVSLTYAQQRHFFSVLLFNILLTPSLLLRNHYFISNTLNIKTVIVWTEVTAWLCTEWESGGAGSPVPYTPTGPAASPGWLCEPPVWTAETPETHSEPVRMSEGDKLCYYT